MRDDNLWAAAAMVAGLRGRYGGWIKTWYEHMLEI